MTSDGFRLNQYRASLHVMSKRPAGEEQLRVGARIDHLIKALGFKSDEAFADATKVLKRNEVSMARNGSTLARTDKWYRAISNAAQVDLETARSYLRGEIDSEGVIDRQALEASPPAPAPQASLRRQLLKRAKERDIPEHAVDRALSARGFHGLTTLEKPQLDTLLDLAVGFERGTELLLRSIVRDAGTDNPLDDLVGIGDGKSAPRRPAKGKSKSG